METRRLQDPDQLAARLRDDGTHVLVVESDFVFEEAFYGRIVAKVRRHLSRGNTPDRHRGRDSAWRARREHTGQECAGRG